MCNCYECIYAGEENGKFFCNFGDSENYGKTIDSETGCDVGEALEDIDK